MAVAVHSRNVLEQSFANVASSSDDSDSQSSEEKFETETRPKSSSSSSSSSTNSQTSESEYEDIEDSDSEEEREATKQHDEFQKELEQLKSIGTARFAKSDAQMNKMLHSFQGLAKSAEKYDIELQRVINQWSDREQTIDTAAHLSLNKSLERMNFKRYDPLEHRVFYKENGEIACEWDCAFICILTDEKESGDERDSDDEVEEEEEEEESGVPAVDINNIDIDTMTDRLKKIVDVPIYTEEIQEVIYLVIMEKDMDKERLVDISKRLFLSLDCINRTTAIPNNLPWRLRVRLLSQRAMKTCMVKVVVGGEEIDEEMKDYILSRGYSVLYRSGFNYRTILV